MGSTARLVPAQTTPAPQRREGENLEAVVQEVLRDAKDAPVQYLDETTVPEGGE